MNSLPVGDYLLSTRAVNARGIGSASGSPPSKPMVKGENTTVAARSFAQRRISRGDHQVSATNAIDSRMISKAFWIAAFGRHDKYISVSRNRGGERDLRAVRESMDQARHRVSK